MFGDEYDDAVAAFLRSRGVTRCPTACVLPIQAIIAAADPAAPEVRATKGERLHERRWLRGGDHLDLWGFGIGRRTG